MGNPQWSDASSDRPEWTERSAQAAQPAQPQSWFDKPAPVGPDDRWRPVSDLTDTAWGLDGAWRDPSAQWNVAGNAPEDGRREPGWDQSGRDRAGWDRDTAWGAEDPARRDTASGAEDPARRDAGWSVEDPARRDTLWGAENAGRRDTAWDAEHPVRGDAGWDAGWATARPRDTGWNPPTDSAWATAEPASAVAVLDRPEEPAAPAEPDRKHPVRHPVRIALFALVLFGLVAGSVAWLSMDKSVTLTVDGDARAVKTYASTVGGVLDDEHLSVGQHDTLAPGRDTRISDGAEIVLRRGRLVTLTVDGTTRKVWTTALTVQEALEQIGYRQGRMWMSADRSTRLPLDGYQLTLRMAKAVTVVADGKKRTISTTAATVGEALDQAGLSVDGDDKVSQLAGAPVRAGMTITVTRVTSKTATTQAVLEFKTVEKTDPDADPGSRTVQTKGVTGLQQVTTVQTYVNGRLTSSKVTKRVVVKKPVDEVVVVGPEPEESTPPPAQPAGCEDFPTTGGLNWCGLAQCESGLNPNAYNPAGPYYGLYQFDAGTWQANGGTGTPSGKSIAEQTRVAYNLYQARGRAPWPVCGKNL